MTYNVFGGTLNLAQSQSQSLLAVSRRRHSVFRLYMYLYPSVSVCVSMHARVIVYYKFVGTIFYKPFLGISTDLQRRCSWAQR